MVDAKQDILEKVKDIVSDQLGVDRDQVNPDSRFMEDLGADSLDTVELVMRMEEEFGVTISDSVAEKLMTVKDVVDFVKNS